MTSYPTNVSNSQWQIIAKFLDVERNRRYSLREIVNAILYLVKTGCQWRMLPSDFPGWKLVYYYFSTWKRASVIEQIHEALVEKVRKKHGKQEEPSVGIIDAQSIKNTLVSIEDRVWFDAGKRIKGIKRHIIVDTLGLILAVVIQSASVQDRVGGLDVVQKLVESWRKVIKIFADAGYSGTLAGKIKGRVKIIFEIIKRDELHKFKVLPKKMDCKKKKKKKKRERERTFAWIDTNRRKR